MNKKQELAKLVADNLKSTRENQFSDEMMNVKLSHLYGDLDSISIEKMLNFISRQGMDYTDQAITSIFMSLSDSGFFD